MNIGCCFIVVSCWPELFLHGCSGRTEDNWVLREKSRPFLKCFCPVGIFLVLSTHFCFFFNVLKRASLFMKILSVKKIPSLMCSAFINKTETRQKKGVLIFFFLLKKYILFLLRQIPYFPLPNENL